MQAASAVQVTVRRFGVWNASICGLGALAWLITAAGLCSAHDDLPRWGVGLLSAAAGLAVLGACTLWRRRPITLRWDGQQWQVAHAKSGSDLVDLSELRVTLDLGGWMLLKFRTDGMVGRPWAGWIPLQRQGLSPHWQPLRGAVYAHGGSWLRPVLQVGRG